ncbi:hypothetical protein [Williamsia sp. Leaf354]|uniref:hypothetical protein n=1 Tax=Williamsia sp. Leaf354 TaxID=1736349 RepID=UPI0012E3E25E|nr:hypothetical protein [Williamsia sp. Leaf354]
MASNPVVQQARAEFKRRVWSSVRFRHYTAADMLYGSFLANDFHLDCSNGESFSDVDVTVALLPSECWNELTTDVQQRFAMWSALRVNFRQHDDLLDVSMAADRFLNLAGFAAASAASRAGGISNGRTLDYATAKALLMLLRTSRGERFREVTTRIDSTPGWLALDIKLGNTARRLDDTAICELLAMMEDHEIRIIFRQILDNNYDPAEMRSTILNGLADTMSNLPISLLDHTNRKLAMI